MVPNPLQRRLAQLLHSQYGHEHAGEAAYVLLHVQRYLQAALPAVLPTGTPVPTVVVRWQPGRLALRHASPAVAAALRLVAAPLGRHVADMLGRPAGSVRVAVQVGHAQRQEDGNRHT